MATSQIRQIELFEIGSYDWELCTKLLARERYRRREKEGRCPCYGNRTESLRTATKSAGTYEAAREEVRRVSRRDEESSKTEAANDR